MIVCKLQGGLGNCLFQYFAGVSASIDNNADIFFDISYFNNKNVNGVVSHFKFNLKNITNNINEYKGNEKLTRLYDSFNYKKISNDNIYMDGYWQSEKYFKHNFQKILSTLNLDIDLLENKNIDFENTISIHIRRGDYINLKHLYNNLNINYYIMSINFILNKNKNVKNIIIFSDDIKWCKDNFKLNSLNVIFSDNKDEVYDMILMSKCKYNIIANSTFSWWSAYLNNNSNKLIISPKKWFTDKMGLNESDIIPSNWIKI